MFTRDALLLIGHGSSSVAEAARPLLAHAEIIRASSRFAEVAVGMLRGAPIASEAFDSLSSPIVHVVPFFLEDGFFTRIAIPDLLLPRAAGSRVIRLCQPLGSHDGIATVIEARLLRHCEIFDTISKSISVLLVGHGSSKNPGRARALRRHADRLEKSGRFGWVRVAHLEEPPSVLESLAGMRGHVVAVVGYLSNEGVHATKDLPRMIAKEQALRGTSWPPVHYLGAIGGDEALPRLLIDQVMATT